LQVLIFTEGSQQWGLGHLNRCLGFARYFQSLGIAVRWVVLGDELAQVFFEELNCGDVSFSNWHNPLSVCKEIDNCFCAIVDSYHAPLEVYLAISNSVRHCIWIDDEARLNYPRGFVVNPNPLVVQRQSRDGSQGYGLLTGFAFQVLRQEFSQPFERSYASSIQRVLVLMGGTDLRELTPLVVNCIEKLIPCACIDVVVPNASQREKWKKLENEKCHLLGTQTADKIRKLMLESDLAVTAAGQTICETAAVGLPTLAIGVVDNQRLHSQALSEAGAVRMVGWYDQKDLQQRLCNELWAVIIQSEREKMGRHASMVVDGNGASRAIAAVLGWSDRLQLNLATLDDSRSVWEISNDPSVRRFSIQKNQIPWNEH